MYPNRTICSVLEGIRKCYETRNFAGLLGLVEEAQVMADKMEAGLEDKSDLKYGHEELKKVTAEKEEIKKWIEKNKDKKDGNEEDS